MYLEPLLVLFRESQLSFRSVYSPTNLCDLYILVGDLTSDILFLKLILGYGIFGVEI